MTYIVPAQVFGEPRRSRLGRIGLKAIGESFPGVNAWAQQKGAWDEGQNATCGWGSFHARLGVERFAPVLVVRLIRAVIQLPLAESGDTRPEDREDR